jgi:O-antigen/teichoic acid export membrane protein
MATQRSFSNAVKWAYTANWGEKAFSSFFMFILAALLGPRDFGMIAIAFVYIGFLAMFLDQGLVAALIQKKDLQKEHLDAVFWMDLVLSLLLVLVSILLGKWWAQVNHAPEAVPFIAVLSLSIPIEALTLVQVALLKRDMDFRSLSIRSNVSVAASGVAGLGMALAGFGAWALVGQLFVRDLIGLTLLWRLSPWRPRWSFSWKHLRELMGFSISNFVAQLGIFADMQASSIALGVLFGPIAVGLYRLADRVMSSVVTMATTSIQTVSLPEFSRLQDRPDELRQSALSCIRLSATVTLPALAGLAAVSTPLMATLGPQWVPAGDVLKVLSVVGMSLTFAYFTGPLLQALSQPRKLAILEWCRAAVSILFLCVIGLIVRDRPTSWHLVGIALARFVPSVFLVTPVFLGILMKLCRISMRDLVSAITPSVSASLGAVIAVSLVQYSGVSANSRPIIQLISEVTVGGAVGGAILVALDRQLRVFILATSQRMMRRPAFSR